MNCYCQSYFYNLQPAPGKLPMKILIIEDEAELANAIASFLEQENYTCETAPNQAQALEKIHLYYYDCVLVDIMLPDGNGLNLVKELKKEKSDAGIIIISARNALDDRIDGLDIGADDYLTKPFHLPELNARIKSLLRRRNHDGNQEIIYNEIKVVPESRQVYVNEQSLKLTRKEYDIITYFIINQERVLTREALAENLIGDQADMLDSFDFIYSHVKNLRKKILNAGGRDYIHAVYAIGYRFGEL